MIFKSENYYYNYYIGRSKLLGKINAIKSAPTSFGLAVESGVVSWTNGENGEDAEERLRDARQKSEKRKAVF